MFKQEKRSRANSVVENPFGANTDETKKAEPKNVTEQSMPSLSASASTFSHKSAECSDEKATPVTLSSTPGTIGR